MDDHGERRLAGPWRHDSWRREGDRAYYWDEEFHREEKDPTIIPLPPVGFLDAGSLSNEIWFLILGFLPLACLIQVISRLSRHFHLFSTAILYREIDCSIHHYKIPDINSSADFTWAHFDCDRVIRKGQHLLKLLTTKQHYASNVRSFSWTVGIRRAERPETVAYGNVQLTLFALLENVTRVDIDTGFATVICTRQNLGVTLFPHASYIRLGGVMSFEFAAAILHGKDKAQLKNLILYNVIAPCGLHVEPPHEDSETAGLCLRSECRTGESLSVPSGPHTRPGCMRGILTSELQERCKELDRLLLRKQGHQHSQQLLQFTPADDEDVYMEWG